MQKHNLRILVTLPWFLRRLTNVQTSRRSRQHAAHIPSYRSCDLSID